MNKTRTLEIIQNIQGYIDHSDNAELRCPFTIIGPSGSVNNLRIYVYGALVGTIAISESKDCTLLNRDYINNYNDALSEEEKERANQWIVDSRSKQGTITGKWCKDVIDTEEYLSISLKLVRSKFRKESGSIKERNIQSQIAKAYTKSQTELDWCIVDIETGFTKQWIPKSKEIVTVKKPDFVVYDCKRKEFGIIELKYENENTHNLSEHYKMFKEIYDVPGYFINELARRARVMQEFSLLNENIEVYEGSDKIWFGFLFVKGGKEKSQNLVRKFFDDTCIEGCRFAYVDDISELDASGISYSCMKSMENFLMVP